MSASTWFFSLSMLIAVEAAAEQVGAPVPPEIPAQWGVSVGFTPRWRGIDSMVTGDRSTPVTLEGTELRLGFVRGRERSGDWGISFMWKDVKEGLTVGDPNDFYRRVTTTRGTAIVGAEVHKFIPFARLRNRLQVGVNLAGGAQATIGP